MAKDMDEEPIATSKNLLSQKFSIAETWNITDNKKI